MIPGNIGIFMDWAHWISPVSLSIASYLGQYQHIITKKVSRPNSQDPLTKRILFWNFGMGTYVF